MLLEINRIVVPPGQTVMFDGVSWQEFEAILEDLGESRNSRIAYDQGKLEITTPLPENIVNKVYLSNFVEILLEELNIKFCSLGSTTFTNKLILRGIEPDSCFYIQNKAVVRGKNQLDLTVDPPPDLAFEINITNGTHLEIYQSLEIPELWRYERGKLQILLLVDGNYIESESSANFPNFPLLEVIPQYLTQCRTEGRNEGITAFRSWVRQQL
ncbi:MAG: Uma2 family endonuclease [Xenococcus sp. MO_188.B8]|nr:Uma2 family endonuclease [Xenococcus sp. MO_188.B8]